MKVGARFARGMAEVPLHRRLQVACFRPDATRQDLERLCKEARELGCLGVCVTPVRVELAASLLEESEVRVVGLVGFPFGTSQSDVKVLEVESVIESGAREVEVVLHPGALRDGNDRAVLRELRDVREAAEERPVTAVVEAGLLTPEEVRRACGLVLQAELQFVATATGCAGRAITQSDLRQLREWVGPELGLKAVGGIGSAELARVLVEAGASRVAVLDLSGFRSDGEPVEGASGPSGGG